MKPHFLFIVVGLVACGPDSAPTIVVLPDPRPAIASALPPGWAIVEQTAEEIPFGHHFCENYDGVRGTKLVVRGTTPVQSEFLSQQNEWRAVTVGTESIDVWVMPGDYRLGIRNSFCFHRPIQPTEVTSIEAVRVFARPSHYESAADRSRFNSLLRESRGVQSPGSPWNDPARLSWRGWQADLAKSFARSFQR